MPTRCRPLLGTFVEITVPDGFEPAIDAAFAAIERIHALMSFHSPTSDLAWLRDAPAGSFVALDPETVTVLAEALRLHRASNGIFDVTIGRRLVEAGFLPRDGIGELTRFTGGSEDIVIFDERSVWLTARVLVDLGGIAKGYAVDRAVETLLAHEVAEGCVNAGGDLRVFGERSWPVALREADGTLPHAIEVRDCAVASSENRSSRRIADGRVLTPHIGPAGGGIAVDERITLIARTCMLADAATKIALVDRRLAERIIGEDGCVVELPVQMSGAG